MRAICLLLFLCVYAEAAYAQKPLKCYFADLHSHTSYSDGALFPSNAYAYARHVAKLDVSSVTDHMGSLNNAEWEDTQRVANRANEEGAFVALTGLEWTTKAGHAVILAPDTRRWPTDMDGMYKATAKAGVIVKINHPKDGKGAFHGLEYSKVGDQAVELMEVRNPEEEQAYIRALNFGWHLAPDGSDDAHKPLWGNRHTWTVILAPTLTRRDILAALKVRHCYSTHDRNCQLFFSINGGVMGDILTESVKTVNAEIVVDDPAARDKTAKIELFQDGVVIQTKRPDSHKCRWRASCAPPAGKHYYFIKVTQSDGDKMWSAPVWVNSELRAAGT